MTSALVAESVGKRLRPLYATGFIHSFVLWYSIEKLFMRSVGLDDYLVTVATLVYIVVMMTANIPLGLLADRWSRKGVLYLATCALIGSSVVCGFSHGLALYATGISVWGLFYAAYAGTYDSAVYDVVLEETGSAGAFERCYGRVQMFEATAFITSALASAVVARYASLRAEYFLTVPFTCCAFFTLSRFREPSLHRTAPRPHLGAHLGQIVRGATGGNAGWIVAALVANCVVMRLLIEFYQLWYLGLALPVLWYGPACALMYGGAWGGGALASWLRGSRTVLIAAAGTLVTAFGLFAHDPRVVIAAQVATIFGVTVLNIALTRSLHDAMPSAIRAGASSVVSTIGYGAFIPAALAFGMLSRSHGIFAASVLVIAPLAVMCVSVARARRWRTQPARLPEALGQLAEIAAAQEQLRLPAGGRPVGSGSARGRPVSSGPAAPYWWPADRARQPGVAGPKVNRVGGPAKSLASRVWQRTGRPGEGAGIAWAGSAAQGQPLRAGHDRPGPVPLGAPVSAGPVPGLAAAPAAGGQPPEWWEGDGQEWGWPGVGDGEEWDGGEQVLAGTEGPPPPDAARIRPSPASLRDPGGTGLRGPWRGAGRRPARRRVAIVAAVIAPLLAAAVLVLAPLTRHSPGPSLAAAGQQSYQAGSAAPAPLPALTYPGQQQRGVFAAIGRIVASRNTIVAIGSQATGSVVRQQFFVSTDGGTTWRLAPVRGPGGGQPPVGYPAARVAGGPGGWLAVGPQATWTSPNGVSWTLSRTHGITPVLPGDQMWVLNSTSDGFLAGGVASGGNGAAQGVIWTSRDGLTWQRKTAAQLGLTRRGQAVRSISYITSRGEDTVMSGMVTDRRCSPVPKTLHRRTRTVTCRSRSYSAAWLSTDGGSTWTPVTVPAGHGAGTRIAGVGFDRSGLVAVRPGRSSSGRGDGVAYFSPNGRAWHYTATIAAAGGWSPSLVKGSGYGFVVTGASATGRILAYTSTGTGTSWQPTAPLGAAASERVSGATVARGGTIIAIGSTAASKVSQRPVFLEAIGGNGMVRQISLTGIPGAVVPELTVNGLATAGGQQVAVGSADGYPAVWRKAAGHPWSLVTSLAQVSAGQSLRTLTAVAHGRAGWLAVGAPGPAVFTSANGTTWQPDGPAADDLAGVTPAVAAAGPAGYVIVGKLPARGQASVASVWWSPDLTSWTRARDVNDVSGFQPGVRGRRRCARLRGGRVTRRPAGRMDKRQRPQLDGDRLAAANGRLGRHAPAGRDQREPCRRPGPGDDRPRQYAARRSLGRRRRHLDPGAVQRTRRGHGVHRVDCGRGWLRRGRPVWQRGTATRGDLDLGQRHHLAARDGERSHRQPEGRCPPDRRARPGRPGGDRHRLDHHPAKPAVLRRDAARPLTSPARRHGARNGLRP